MKFYDRNIEIETLEKIYKQCQNTYGKITVLTGRRRVGKTLLAKEYAKNKKSIYLFTSKKAEKLLCDEFMPEYEEFTGSRHIGEINKFIEIFELLLKYGKENPYVLIIDEFQEFNNINYSVYSEIQKLWDKYKFETKVHIVFIGSIYSLMINIFQNEKEPLYGRADRIIYIKPFQAKVIKEILEDYNSYSGRNLFYNYLITGGIPRYQELLIESGCYNKESIINFILEKDSFFISEGRNLLIQEFGKEYGIYFSVLELMSLGRTSRNEIESILERSVGGYLERLEIEYDIIEKVKPIGARKESRNQKYVIKDNFIRFWFRFIYKNMTIIENERFDYIKRIIERDLSTYSGPVLEKLFIEIIGYSSEYGLIGTYWEKGNQNEIDIIAINDIEKKILLCEVKMNKQKININKLKNKSDKLQRKYHDYNFAYEALSIEDIEILLENTI
ncbi:MAG: ATP-binding protein [Spirochaetales bacterium]|nr:ATP-binding protein [Spirochaetales bacterium]